MTHPLFASTKEYVDRKTDISKSSSSNKHYETKLSFFIEKHFQNQSQSVYPFNAQNLSFTKKNQRV